MPNTSEIRNLTFLLIITILMIVSYGQINYWLEPFSNYDLSSYRKMASVSPKINIDIPLPFANRIFGPYIIGLIPISDILAFYISSIFFSICLSFQFYYLLRYVGLSSTISTVTVSLFLFNKYFFGITIWDFFQINDLLSLNFIIIMLLSMWRNQWIIFGLVLTLGAFTKEIPLLMVPVTFIYLLEKKKLSINWKKVVLAAIPAVIIFILIRVLMPSSGGKSLLEAFFTYSKDLWSIESILRKLVNSYLPYYFILIIFYKHTIQFFRANKYMLLYICLVFISTFFGADNERLMAPTFIVFYLLIGTILQEINPKKTYLLFLIVIGFLTSFHHVYGKYSLPNINWTYLITFVGTLSVTIYTYFLKQISNKLQ